jgi:hypothetical protein
LLPHAVLQPAAHGRGRGAGYRSVGMLRLNRHKIEGGAGYSFMSSSFTDSPR